VPTLLAEVTRAWEATATVEATHIAVVLATQTSTQEATVTWDSATLRVNDVEDQASLTEREALETVLRVEVENVMALAFACKDAKGFV
jgi:hypothetical protein